MATGQPSSGKPKYGELAHCLLGATNEVLGDFVGVTRRTIRNWIATHLDFADAVRCGRAVVDARGRPGIVRPAAYDPPPQGGRPPQRWEVNPGGALAG